MKKMEYTTKTECNRRNSESRIVKLCLNVCARREQKPTNLFDRALPSRRQRCIYMNVMPSSDGGRQLVNPLSLRDLWGGIGFAVTSSFTYRYRAFRRCQTRAQAEGFVRLYV